MICYNIYFISFTDICQTLFLVFYHKFSTTTKNLCYYFNTKCGTPTKHTATHNLRFIWTIFTATNASCKTRTN